MQDEAAETAAGGAVREPAGATEAGRAGYRFPDDGHDGGTDGAPRASEAGQTEQTEQAGAPHHASRS